MPENRKLILDKFQEYIDADFDVYCQRHQIPSSPNSLLTFLIDQNLIPSITIKRYTVIHEFENLIQDTQRKKTESVNVLSDRFNIPERTIWGILRKKER